MTSSWRLPTRRDQTAASTHEQRYENARAGDVGRGQYFNRAETVESRRDSCGSSALSSSLMSTQSLPGPARQCNKPIRPIAVAVSPAAIAVIVLWALCRGKPPHLGSRDRLFWIVLARRGGTGVRHSCSSNPTAPRTNRYTTRQIGNRVSASPAPGGGPKHPWRRRILLARDSHARLRWAAPVGSGFSRTR